MSSVSDSPDWKYENNIEWQYENRKVLCDHNIIYIKYIRNLDDPEKFSPLFIQALTQRIASELSIPIASSRTLRNDHWSLYLDKISEADNKDGLQGKHTNKKIKSGWLSRARLR